MSARERTGKQLLALEIAQARAYLEGTMLREQRPEKLAEKSTLELEREAELLREAVMLRQQREVAEHVRATIERDRAALSPRSSAPTS